MLKTRRRKGLGDQIAVSKYLDDEFVVSDSVQRLKKRDYLRAQQARPFSIRPRRLTRVAVGKLVFGTVEFAYVALRKTVNKQILYLIACLSL